MGKRKRKKKKAAKKRPAKKKPAKKKAVEKKPEKKEKKPVKKPARKRPELERLKQELANGGKAAADLFAALRNQIPGQPIKFEELKERISQKHNLTPEQTKTLDRWLRLAEIHRVTVLRADFQGGLVEMNKTGEVPGWLKGAVKSLKPGEKWLFIRVDPLAVILTMNDAYMNRIHPKYDGICITGPMQEFMHLQVILLREKPSKRNQELLEHELSHAFFNIVSSLKGVEKTFAGVINTHLPTFKSEYKHIINPGRRQGHWRQNLLSVLMLERQSRIDYKVLSEKETVWPKTFEEIVELLPKALGKLGKDVVRGVVIVTPPSKLARRLRTLMK